ncbi:hypothetical protein ACE6H2_007269 [Prunus campanulata]
MAFCNKVGSLLRHSISQNGQAPMASMLNAARCMSSKLFIGGLSFGTSDESLKEAFSSFGDVTEVAQDFLDDRDSSFEGFLEE